MEERNDRFTAIEDRFSGYEVYDRDGDKIGKVDDLFVDQGDEPEYIGVKMGFLGTSSTLIPWDLVSRVDEEDSRIEVSAEKSKAKDGPTFDNDQDITPDYEREVRDYYGLAPVDGADDRGSYSDYYSDTGADREEEGELRVPRTEEELRAGTREREAGGVNVRKRVRTDREQVTVPKRREEVHVDRVPVDETEGERGAAEAEIGEDEVRVPVVEDEVVVEKKPVAKEEVRVRKDVVADEEVVEEDVRKEEIDVDDETGRRG
jgi:uncharacterized protein (TIGR02271 family)